MVIGSVDLKETKLNERRCIRKENRPNIEIEKSLDSCEKIHTDENAIMMDDIERDRPS